MTPLVVDGGLGGFEVFVDLLERARGGCEFGGGHLNAGGGFAVVVVDVVFAQCAPQRGCELVEGLGK